MEQALIVRRWRRYGADRLYVTADTGAPLGSVDLTTGQVESARSAGSALGGAGLDGAGLEDVGLEDVVRGAAQAYLRADLPELVVPASAVLPSPPVPPVTPRPHGRRAAGEPSAAAGAASRGASAGSVPTAASDAPAGGRHRAADLVRPHPAGDEQTAGEPLAERLDRLVLAGWHVLPAVPVGRQGSVVPYLLVGPAGAFAVAERPAGAPGGEQLVLDGRHLSADGHGVPDLRDIRLTAARAGSLLRAAVGSPVGVRGVLVVHGPVTVRSPAAVDALVVGRDEVPDVLEDLPVRWTRGRVDAVAAVARRRSTWALTWA
ncbi:NERD domain-containing protein [Cellulomonas sp. ES6]|uniref:NERD domain-containing protein n=1 Tax=Cellulomonas sp. ES6 TaxID=3039384 RepID=UPI0024B6CB3C|nr:NERD domain-containing protein [Cellulomonas sp. ES6]WHP16888.1 NERD domain-containing protein [Cellulomonas sp. ES6]